MKNIVICLLLFAAIASAQHKQRVAVLPSVGDLDPQGLILLTDKVREIATKNLPISDFNILKQDVITKMIGEEELYRSCKEGVCIGDLAKKTNANYGARCDVIKFDDNLVLKFELYSVNEEAIFETFTDYDVKNFRGMLASLEARLPSAFQKMMSASKSREVTGGIGSVEYGGETYLAIKPAYSGNIGANKGWSLSINGKAYSTYENALSPGDYSVRLSHDCYEEINFRVGIVKGRSETFDVAQHLKLKTGVLVLDAQKNGAPVSETVFVNGSPAGQTPFNGAVPVCSEITIGSSRNKVNVTPAHNQTVRHKYIFPATSAPPPVFAAARPKESAPYAAQQAKPRITLRAAGASTSTGATVNKTTDGNKTLTANFQQNDTPLPVGTFMDTRDGKTYKTVTIGSQVWMVENLNYDVPDVTSDACYSNNDANCEKYGRLYNWATAMGGASSSSLSPSGVQGACPVGWHLPSDAEWTALTNYVGSNAGTKLKSSTSWNSYGNGTDQYGFSALPGGGGGVGSFYDSGYYGSWWSATEYYASDAWHRDMHCDDGGVGRYNNSKTFLYSVRCVQNP